MFNKEFTVFSFRELQPFIKWNLREMHYIWLCIHLSGFFFKGKCFRLIKYTAKCHAYMYIIKKSASRNMLNQIHANMLKNHCQTNIVHAKYNIFIVWLVLQIIFLCLENLFAYVLYVFHWYWYFIFLFSVISMQNVLFTEI